jgi:hypothetical protein
MRHQIAVLMVGLAFAFSAGCVVVQPVPVAARPAPGDAPAGESSEPGDNVSIFYDTLAPFGQWVTVAPYGLCWAPDGMEVGWRPYTHGHWDDTDDGWLFDSDYPWGWACFHYGRWFWHSSWGWCWVPGRVWAPAWCAWRSDDVWFGWCPLPPSPAFLRGIEIQIGDFDWDDAGFWRGWSFCERRHFCDVDLDARIVILARNVTILRGTRHVRGIRFEKGRVVNHCFGRDEVEHAIGRRVIERRIEDRRDHDGDRRPRVEGNRLSVFRPHISSDRPSHLPPSRPPRTDMGPPELLRRQAAERQGIEGRLYGDRNQLNRFQRGELERPRPREDLDNVLRDQREERQAFEEHERAARQLMEQRQQREWQRSRETGGRPERGSSPGRDEGRASRSEHAPDVGRGNDQRGQESGRSDRGGDQRGQESSRNAERGPNVRRGSDQRGQESGRGGAGPGREDVRGGDSGRGGPPQRGDGGRGGDNQRGSEGGRGRNERDNGDRGSESERGAGPR